MTKPTQPTPGGDDDQLYGMIMEFRDAIAQDRDRLYRTRVVTTEPTMIATEKLVKGLKSREAALRTKILTEAMERGPKDIPTASRVADHQYYADKGWNNANESWRAALQAMLTEATQETEKQA